MTPSEERIAFYYEVGFALASWAEVEDELRRTLVAPFHEQINRNGLSNGFFALEGARAKRDFVEAVVARHLAGTVHAEPWKKLIARAGNAASQRNKLAHWRVAVYAKGRPGRRYALEEWVYPKKILRQHANGPKPGALCLRDVVKLRYEFIAIMAAINNFRHRVAGEDEPFEKGDEQASNPPPIGTLRKMILQALARTLKEPEAAKG